MKLTIKVGDVLNEGVDVLICTANPGLQMTGGVNGELLQRGGDRIRDELNAYIKSSGKPVVDRGTVVKTGPGPLSVKHILHAVGVNAFYESSSEVITRLMADALILAAELDARTVATPMIATG